MVYSHRREITLSYRDSPISLSFKTAALGYCLVVSIGIEPMTFPLSGERSGLLSYETIWWFHPVSNLDTLGYEPSALTNLSYGT